METVYHRTTADMVRAPTNVLNVQYVQYVQNDFPYHHSAAVQLAFSHRSAAVQSSFNH
jgi:hypothetical protein